MHGKVCSHPGKNLEEHLLNVLEWAEELAEFYALPLSDQEKTAIALHDIGKAAVLFQGKLCPNCPERSNCPNPYPRVKGKSYGHAEPSSFIVLARTDSIICAEAVRRHHTGLQDLQEIKNFWADTGIDEQKGQVSSLFWWDGASTLYKCIGIKAGKWAEILTRTEDSWQDFYFNSIESEYSRDNVQQISQTWVDIRKLSSLLVTSDRWDAMVGTGFLLSKESWDKASFDDYLASLKPNELSPWRASISQMVYISANEKLASPGIYTITLPTGAGKTIIGLETAVQAAHRFKATGIIYVLPFISLVDQNAKVAGEIFEKIQEDHSLAYTDTSAQDSLVNSNKESNKEYDFTAFFRYWSEPTVVTTLSKLWDVIYSPKINDTMSFHRLSNAVVILDEPQSIPLKYWEGFGKTLEFISQQYNTTFILMTATQPELVKGIELVPEPIKFPKNRHIINWLEDSEGKDMCLDELLPLMIQRGLPSVNTLIVLNTRKAALQVFFQARRQGLTPEFLSAWVTPVDRARILNDIREKEEAKERRFLVSTQVVEAGMDFDFDLVFRDLAPLDSIIQVAGRCNRHGLQGLGQVLVACLRTDAQAQRAYCFYVYDKVLLNHTRNILQSNPEINERDYSELVTQYYRGLKNPPPKDTLWNGIVKGAWGQYPSLYDSVPNEANLLIDYDGSIEHDLNKLQSLERSLDNLEKRRKIMISLRQNAISVPSKYLEEWDSVTGGFIFDETRSKLEQLSPSLWILHPEGIGKIYDNDCGFIPLEIYKSNIKKC